jgi:hypothetical protein
LSLNVIYFIKLSSYVEHNVIFHNCSINFLFFQNIGNYYFQSLFKSFINKLFEVIPKKLPTELTDSHPHSEFFDAKLIKILATDANILG